METPQLLSLPPELRNRIYAFTFAADSPHSLLSGDHPITRTCHQTRAESLDLFYAASEFELKVPYMRVSTLAPIATLALAMKTEFEKTGLEYQPSKPRHIHGLHLRLEFHDPHLPHRNYPAFELHD